MPALVDPPRASKKRRAGRITLVSAGPDSCVGSQAQAAAANADGLTSESAI
jgi:hypothetical protein